MIHGIESGVDSQSKQLDGMHILVTLWEDGGSASCRP